MDTFIALLYKAAGLAAFIGGMGILAGAFKDSIGKGFACLCFPPYMLYYAFARYESPQKKLNISLWLGGIVIGVAVFSVALGLGVKKGIEEVNKKINAPAQTIENVNKIDFSYYKDFNLPRYYKPVPAGWKKHSRDDFTIYTPPASSFKETTSKLTKLVDYGIVCMLLLNKNGEIDKDDEFSLIKKYQIILDNSTYSVVDIYVIRFNIDHDPLEVYDKIDKTLIEKKKQLGNNYKYNYRVVSLDRHPAAVIDEGGTVKTERLFVFTEDRKTIIMTFSSLTRKDSKYSETVKTIFQTISFPPPTVRPKTVTAETPPPPPKSSASNPVKPVKAEKEPVPEKKVQLVPKMLEWNIKDLDIKNITQSPPEDWVDYELEELSLSIPPGSYITNEANEVINYEKRQDEKGGKFKYLNGYVVVQGENSPIYYARIKIKEALNKEKKPGEILEDLKKETAQSKDGIWKHQWVNLDGMLGLYSELTGAEKDISREQVYVITGGYKLVYLVFSPDSNSDYEKYKSDAMKIFMSISLQGDETLLKKTKKSKNRQLDKDSIPFEIAAYSEDEEINKRSVKKIPVSIDRKGEWNFELSWEEKDAILSVILDGPGQIGNYASYMSKPPIKFHITINRKILKRGDSWVFIIENDHSFPVHGNLHMIKPGN